MIKPQPRPLRGSKLDPYTDHIDHRLSKSLENCRVLLREVRALGYEGGYTTVADYVRPRRRARQPQATLHFETGPGEQAQVDWGSFSYLGDDGRQHRVWAFLMVLSWSRAIYVEFVRRADVASFIQCQGGDPGPGSRGPRRVEPEDAGLLPACRLRDAGVPTLLGPDQGKGGERREVYTVRFVHSDDFFRAMGPSQGGQLDGPRLPVLPDS